MIGGLHFAPNVTYPGQPKQTGGGKPRIFRGDAMQMGVHSALRDASAHKKMVSGVLHLKHEAMGHRTAFHLGKKAFKYGGS